MIYGDLPAGATVFLDASVFIHHFEPNALFGPAATEFLERIENQEIGGLTATHVVSEIAHRLMTIEAMQAFGWQSTSSHTVPAVACWCESGPMGVFGYLGWGRGFA